MNKLSRQAVFYTVLLAAWIAVARMRVWPPYLFPSPGDVWQSLRFGFADHSFVIAIGTSLRRVLIGYGIAVLLGVLLDLLIASSRFLQETLGSLLLGLQSLPSICWLPLAVLWFGLTEKAIVFVVVMGAVLSITIAMESGRRQMPRIYGQAGRNLGAHGLRLFFFVSLPASLPYLLAGLKQGWAFAWRALISGEMIFVSLGLGQLLMMGRDLNDMSQVVAAMALIVAIGYAVDGLIFRTLERQLQHRWGLERAA